MPYSRKKCVQCDAIATDLTFITANGLCEGCAISNAVDMVTAALASARAVSSYSYERQRWVQRGVTLTDHISAMVEHSSRMHGARRQ